MKEHYEPSDKLTSVRSEKERDRSKAWVEFFFALRPLEGMTKITQQNLLIKR